MIDDRHIPTFCTNCGSALDVGYRFCGTCGHAAAFQHEPQAEASAESPGRHEPDEHATVIDDMSAIVAAARAGAKAPAANLAEPEPVDDESPPVVHPPGVPHPVPLPGPVPPPAEPPLQAYPAPAPYAPHPAYASPIVVAGGTSTNGFAIASLVLGIVWLYWLGSLLALIFGAVAISQIRKSNGRQTGEGMAIAGLVLGIVGLGLLLILVIIGVAIA